VAFLFNLGDLAACDCRARNLEISPSVVAYSQLAGDSFPGWLPAVRFIPSKGISGQLAQEIQFGEHGCNLRNTGNK
jgi:hypothetical protein